MQQTRILFFTLIVLAGFFLAACERTNSVCPPEVGVEEPTLQLSELIETTTPVSSLETISIEIAGKQMKVDKLVDYPLCNDDWSGTVYVSCEVQVAQAELDTNANPLFLKGCNLNITPNTVVYVAAHNDAAYYKGCSCHTGGAFEP